LVCQLVEHLLLILIVPVQLPMASATRKQLSKIKVMWNACALIDLHTSHLLTLYVSLLVLASCWHVSRYFYASMASYWTWLYFLQTESRRSRNLFIVIGFWITLTLTLVCGVCNINIQYLITLKSRRQKGNGIQIFDTLQTVRFFICWRLNTYDISIRGHKYDDTIRKSTNLQSHVAF
jgi:hypothetical protein